MSTDAARSGVERLRELLERWAVEHEDPDERAVCLASDPIGRSERGADPRLTRDRGSQTIERVLGDDGNLRITTPGCSAWASSRTPRPEGREAA